MSDHRPTLHLVCGKIAAGKSTLCRALAHDLNAPLIAEDDWLSALYPGEIATLDDYIRCSARLRQPLTPHVVRLLDLGLSVVLDFQGNTPARRAWMRTIFEAAGADHRLHLLDPPDAVCKARLRARNEGGAHPYQTTDAEYDLITSHFVRPAADEGFNLVIHPVS